MTEAIASVITGVLGLLAGTVGFYLANRYLEKRREFLSTRKEQLEYVYSPLEILMRMNKREFDRYFKPKTTKDDKVFIETHVWHRNNLAIKGIIMERSHLLTEIPDEFLKLLTHINVWLTEYDLVYVKKEKDPPVFAGPKGYGYPPKADTYVYERAANLRCLLNIQTQVPAPANKKA